MNESTEFSELAATLAASFPNSLLRGDLDEVEKAIREQSKAFDPAVEPYVAYLCNTSGKRIRPALVFLAAGATGGITADHLKIAVTLELIHVATLVHDDIIDGAEIRRQAPTANAKWGNSLSVLLGDCLFAHALKLSTEFEDRSIGRKVAEAANEVCMGEIIQTQRRFDFQLSRDDYFEIIRKKTAALFAAAMELGAILNHQPEAVVKALFDYGSLIGTAYQVYDDCLDLIGDEADVGKTLRTDLNKGKLTLPILNLIAAATDRQRDKLNRLLLQKEPIDLGALASIADYEGAIESAVESGIELVSRARASLIVLPDNEYSQGLHQIAGFLESLLKGCRQ
ncbi:MAG: polyprenyl synthetase family protein [Verrucomicrobiae bacterium]|nr:polyprenyl synthetase family protein [Verrucomicrobiae bacterium]MCB1092868.1 polyprenyl synthetase family protein [Verrucomicrobiae bacterium]